MGVRGRLISRNMIEGTAITRSSSTDITQAIFCGRRWPNCANKMIDKPLPDDSISER